MNVSAQESVAASESVNEYAEFVITNPGDQVTAYAEQPLVFYVRARGAVSYEMTVGVGTGDNAAVFDPKTGQFKWTPQEEDL